MDTTEVRKIHQIQLIITITIKGEIFIMHIADMGSILRTSYGSPKPIRSEP